MIENPLACAVVHDSVAEEPACTVVGFAESVQTGAIGVGCGSGGAVQVDTDKVSVSVVTVPPKASNLPVQVVFAPTVIPALLIIVPANVVFAARVAAADGVQNTSQDDAPDDKVTTEPAVVVRAPGDLKMKVPLPLRLRGPPTFIAPEAQYTPGAYTPAVP